MELQSNKTAIKDEINQSKQILFNKHIGDQKRCNFFNLKNRPVYRRDHSDDTISSNYPNSSYSTVRDLTCSSLSSALPSSSALFEDFEHDLSVSLAPSDSFDYENFEDKGRIKQMDERWRWKSPDVERKYIMQQRKMVEYIEQQKRNIFEPEDYENLTESDHSFTFEKPKEASDSDLSTVKLSAVPIPVAPATLPRRDVVSKTKIEDIFGNPFRRRGHLLETSYESNESRSSSLLSNLATYTSEHLARAKKFGAVVTALRKPGRHIGPAKNPDCECEHCRRFIADREMGRGRALSLGSASSPGIRFRLMRKE